MHTLRVGTHMSDLALAQATRVAEQVVEANQSLDGYELIHLVTAGEDPSAPSSTVEPAVLTARLREALVAGECDIVVHEAGNLPAVDHPDFTMFFPKRVSPHDTFVGHVDNRALPHGAKVGTDSPQRTAQMKHFRRDLNTVDLDGNIPTRLARIHDDLDGVIVARADLVYLGIDTGQDLPYEVMVPVAGQGALAVETNQEALVPLLEKIDDPTTRLEMLAERAFIAELNPPPSAPVSILGESTGKTVALHARFTGEGSKVEIRRSSNNPVKLGTDLAMEFAKRGVRP